MDQLRYLMKLKEVKRGGKVGNRAESTAEHVWAVLILADYFIEKYHYNDLDKGKVFSSAIYHDVVEIESGDTFILDDNSKKNQLVHEKNASLKIISNLPEQLKEIYKTNYADFEGLQSREAQFVKAVDALEPMIHWLDYKGEWREKGFTEEKLRRWKEMAFTPFPEMRLFFEELLDYLKKEDYID